MTEKVQFHLREVSKPDPYHSTIYYDLLAQPEAKLVPTIQSYIAGDIIPWVEPSALEREARMRAQDRSDLVQVLRTMIDRPSDASEVAFTLLAEDLARFTPNADLIKDVPRWREWYLKMAMAEEIHRDLVIKDVLDGQIPPDAQAYKELVAQQADQWSETVHALQRDDLGYLLPAVDFSQQHLHLYDRARVKTLTDTKPRSTDKTLQEIEAIHAIIKQAEQYAAKERLLLILKPTEQLDLAWSQLGTNLTRKQIADVVAVLPALKSSECKLEVLVALEQSLSVLQPATDDILLHPEGMKEVLGWQWDQEVEKYGDFSSDVYIEPHFLTAMEAPMPIDALPPAPRKLFPVTALGLLHLTPPETRLTTIQTLHEQVRADKTLQQPWFLSLLVSAKMYPQLAPALGELVKEWDQLQKGFKEVFLDEAPGKIWLTKQGKLRVTSPERAIDGYVLHTSAKQQVEEETVPHKASENVERKQSLPTVPTAEEVVVLPFTGATACLTPEVVEPVAHSLIQEQRIAEERLLDDVDLLQQRWRNSPVVPENRVFLPALNPADTVIQEAKEHGIAAIHISEKTVTFTMQPGFFVASGHEHLPIALTGILEDSGQLRFQGVPDTFIGTIPQLFFNRLALHCATQEVKPYDQSDQLAKETRRRINETLAGWKIMRGELPQVTTKPNKTTPSVVVTADEASYPVLLWEC